MISVVIPTLNEEVLLPGLLEQLRDQQLRSRFNIEVIIADGGSTDRTVDTAVIAADKFISQDESGPQNIAAGRNHGASVAEGDIIMFINADIRFNDILGFFEWIDTEFKNDKVVAMTCFVKTFPELQTYKDILFHGFYNNYFYLLNKLGLGMGRGECQIIRRDIFVKVDGYKNYLAAGEDFDLFKRISAFGEILFSRQRVVYESPRRYHKYGYFKVAWSWTKNAISILRYDKSNSDTWEPVR